MSHDKTNKFLKEYYHEINARKVGLPKESEAAVFLNQIIQTIIQLQALSAQLEFADEVNMHEGK